MHCYGQGEERILLVANDPCDGGWWVDNSLALYNNVNKHGASSGLTEGSRARVEKGLTV